MKTLFLEIGQRPADKKFLNINLIESVIQTETGTAINMISGDTHLASEGYIGLVAVIKAGIALPGSN
jgi:hypothetical protein